MKKLLSVCLLFAMLCTVAEAQLSAFDPTNPQEVRQWSRGIVGEKLPAFPKPLDSNYCWDYDAGNYWPSEECSYSPDSDCNHCLNLEQQCVQQCDARCPRNGDGDVNNANGSCFESCGDTCRQQRDQCWNANNCQG